MIKVSFSKIHGRGVFAAWPIPKGTELECDVLLFDNEAQSLKTWSYPWSRNHYSVCMGFGSFLNHSEIPNVKIERIDKEKLTKTFKVIKDINEGEELFLNYGNAKFHVNTYSD
jgi:SET domain-containing protein